jgi:hypothetical protein
MAGPEKAQAPTTLRHHHRTGLSLPPSKSHNLILKTLSCGILAADRISLADALLPCQPRSSIRSNSPPTWTGFKQSSGLSCPAAVTCHFRAPTTLNMETRVTSSVIFFSCELITKNILPPKHLFETFEMTSLHH